MYKVFKESSWNYCTREPYLVSRESQFFDNREKAMEYLLNIARDNKSLLNYEGTEFCTDTDYYSLLIGSKVIQYGLAPLL